MNNPIRFNDPTGHLCEPGDCYSSGESNDKDDLGVTLKGWSDENKAAAQKELKLLANRLKNAYDKFRLNCRRAMDDCSDTPAMNASQIFQQVFGNLTWTRDTSGYGGCDASEYTCGSETNDYATDPDDVGLLTHEFGHLFDHRITGSFGYGRNVLGKSTILDANGKYVEGIPIGGGAWKRYEDGYAGTGRPHMQHPLDMGGGCPGSSACEDFADMFMNWAQNSFADNAAGQARYDWMDARMGSWVYSSINR
jgi:hypothetical protein